MNMSKGVIFIGMRLNIKDSLKNNFSLACNTRWTEMFMLIFFLVYFAVGMISVADYGLSADEVAQRRHSLVSYKYVNRVIFNRDIPELEDYPDLEEYGVLYGVALQMPMVFVEDLYDFSLTTRQIYLMRHYFTFLICFAGYVFFFLALKRLFEKNKIVPILGTLMIALYPRFFAIQCVDLKNLVFASLNMVTIFFMVMAVDKEKSLWEMLFGCSVALAANTRMMAVLYIVLVVGYYILVDMTQLISDKRAGRKNEYRKVIARGGKYCWVMVSFALFWILITPKAWTDPVSIFFNTYEKFSNYTSWNGTMVFMGRIITCDEMPWYYLFIWFGISIPVMYLVLFVAAHILLARDFSKCDNKWVRLISTYKWPLCMALLFWGSVWAVILLRSRIYVGWHHMYFVFVPFCVLACFGLDEIIKRVKQRRIVVGAVIVLLMLQCFWMIYNHPRESSYFNIIGKPFAAQFDREEWRLCSLSLYEWILENDEGQFSVSGETGSINLLTEDEKSRIINEDFPKYIIDCYRNVIGNRIEYSGYEEVYTVWVDGYKVGSVFRRID